MPEFHAGNLDDGLESVQSQHGHRVMDRGARCLQELSPDSDFTTPFGSGVTWEAQTGHAARPRLTEEVNATQSRSPAFPGTPR